MKLYRLRWTLGLAGLLLLACSKSEPEYGGEAGELFSEPDGKESVQSLGGTTRSATPAGTPEEGGEDSAEIDLPDAELPELMDAPAEEGAGER